MQQKTLDPGPRRWEEFAGIDIEIENSAPVTVIKHDDGSMKFSLKKDSPETFTLFGRAPLMYRSYQE